MTFSSAIPLPHNTRQVFLTDGGFETWLLFHKGFDLPEFAAFPLLKTEKGRAAMTEYFQGFMDMARDNDAGYILDTCTWRANPDWAQKLGLSFDELAEVNRESVRFADGLRTRFGAGLPVLINGVIGPRGDGYDPKEIMSSSVAEDYHAFQVGVFAYSNVDMVSAITMTNVPEAVGIARAAAEVDLPCVISFTLETDGRLPTGEPLSEAIGRTDDLCQVRPDYYMINCAHPDHFAEMLKDGGDWISRIHGVRANASRLSHAELDEAEELDIGDPLELGAQYVHLRSMLPKLNVLGGCCGTDHRHVSHVCAAVRAAA